MRSDAERLRDILDAIDQIRKYSSKGREAFDQDQLIQVWIVHHLVRLGEATARLSPKLRRHRQMPWKQIIGMRNILVHEYFRIDPETVWTAVEIQLPPREERVRAIVAELEGQ
ncbi:MAG: HepT-like ribonuclease domain-containing protein [Geminicoccaceae bacterium]